MSTTAQNRGQRLWALFTDTPQLSSGQVRSAKAEGRRIIPTTQRGFDPKNPTPKQCAFAQSGPDHLGVVLIFTQINRAQAAKLRAALAAGESTADWPWPMTHAEDAFERLSWNDRQEAWRLFGEGGVL